MGTDAHLVVVGGPSGLAEHARSRIGRLESLWSRFRPDSDVSRMNASAGTPVEVSAETLLLVERALAGRELSGGAFDASVLEALLAAGYDRDFEELVRLGPHLPGKEEPSRAPRPAPGGSAAPVELGPGTVRLQEGVGFDSGGIAKGLATDLLVPELLALGAEGACVNLGGDLRVGGRGPEGGGWTVGVEHPWSAGPLALAGLGEGAVATSTTLRRRWLVGGEWRHHLIDPRSGLPSDSDLNHVTVVAAEAWVAEVLAKAVLLTGAELAFDILGGTGAEALAVDEAGGVRATEGFSAYLGGARLPPSLPLPAAATTPPARGPSGRRRNGRSGTAR